MRSEVAVPVGCRAEPQIDDRGDGVPLDLPTPAGIAAAALELRPQVEPTPLVRSELLSEALDADVWLKNETVSPVASFKLRGAVVALLRARARDEVRGAVTSSTGNHGQGVAHAARLLGLRAHVFLPERPNPSKRRMIGAFGAEIHLGGHDLDAAKDLALEYAADDGLVFVDDGESLDLMEGAGTVGSEIARGLDEIDVVIVPMGSGTLATGVGTAVKGVHRDATIIAVQSAAAAAMVESFQEGRPVERPARTVADGLVCRRPAARALAGIRAVVDRAVAVPDGSIVAAMRTMMLDAHLLVEPAGAAPLAAAWAAREELRGRRIVLVASGSNATADDIERALDSPGLGG